VLIDHLLGKSLDYFRINNLLEMSVEAANSWNNYTWPNRSTNML